MLNVNSDQPLAVLANRIWCGVVRHVVVTLLLCVCELYRQVVDVLSVVVVTVTVVMVVVVIIVVIIVVIVLSLSLL